MSCRAWQLKRAVFEQKTDVMRLLRCCLRRCKKTMFFSGEVTPRSPRVWATIVSQLQDVATKPARLHFISLNQNCKTPHLPRYGPLPTLGLLRVLGLLLEQTSTTRGDMAAREAQTANGAKEGGYAYSKLDAKPAHIRLVTLKPPAGQLVGSDRLRPSPPYFPTNNISRETAITDAAFRCLSLLPKGMDFLLGQRMLHVAAK